MDDSKNSTALAVLTGKSIDALTSVVKSTSDGPIGRIVNDHLEVLRWQNLNRLADKVREITAHRAAEGKPSIPLPASLEIPVIEAASRESEDEMQALWAALIANATHPQKRFQVSKVLVKLLEALQPLDAAVLRLLESDYQVWAAGVAEQMLKDERSIRFHQLASAHGGYARC